MNYLKRLNHYLPVEIKEISIIYSKKTNPAEQKLKEAKLIMDQTDSDDFIILLDEGGKQFSSVELAGWFQKRMNSGIKKLTFVVGGPYGFSDALKLKSTMQLSMSKMTFSHQMIRLFFLEQLYRALTIINNEPYHNQ